MQPPPYINDNIYALSPQVKKERGIEALPANLAEALTAFEHDELLCRTLGEALVEIFLELKWKEVKDFSTTVHPWELEKYVNI